MVGFGDGLSISLPIRLLSGSHKLKLHRHGVSGDGFASVGGKICHLAILSCFQFMCNFCSLENLSRAKSLLHFIRTFT